MKYVAVALLACSALVVSCGDKFDEMKKGLDAAKQVSKNVEKMADEQSEAQKVYEARKAKGDTVAKPYKELQTMLPTAISGFKAEGEPSGAQQTMGEYSYSNASQNWVSESNPALKLVVSVNDWGGGQGAYGMASMAFAMTIEMEDGNQRIQKLKLDAPMTNGTLTYNKQNHDVSAIAGSQYRYILTATLNGAQDDQSALVTTVMQDFAKAFEGK